MASLEPTRFQMFLDFMALHGVWVVLFILSLNLSLILLSVGSAVVGELATISRLLALQVEITNAVRTVNSMPSVASPALVEPVATSSPSPATRAVARHFAKR